MEIKAECFAIMHPVGANLCVRPILANEFIWADTSVCPYG